MLFEAHCLKSHTAGFFFSNGCVAVSQFVCNSIKYIYSIHLCSVNTYCTWVCAR